MSGVTVNEFVSDHALVKCTIPFDVPPALTTKTVTFKRYNKINMTSLRNDLLKSSFVSCPGTTIGSIFHQYTHDLSGLLDKHAPQITRNFHKEKAKWLSESFQEAKLVKR